MPTCWYSYKGIGFTYYYPDELPEHTSAHLHHLQGLRKQGWVITQKEDGSFIATLSKHIPSEPFEVGAKKKDKETDYEYEELK